LIAVLLVGTLCISGLFAQETGGKEEMYKVTKQNGVVFVGKILSRDAREILIETEELGLVYIPKHEISEIIVIEEGQKVDGGGLFGTRYFLTTNGFPVMKGENYVQWNIFGPDFQFGVADHFGMGIMTSWVGIPIIGTAKYSRHLSKNVSGGIGFLGGTGSWAFPQYGLLLPFGFLTFGDRINNINFSAGYGALFTEASEWVLTDPTEQGYTNGFEENTYSQGESRPLFSIAGMFKINSKFSFVFDSFLMLKGKDREVQRIDSEWNPDTGLGTFFITTETEPTQSLLVISPGLRFQANENSSFQFGFTGIRFEGEFVPVPIPMVQWFRKI
jgi:hypothetical protein